VVYCSARSCSDAGGKGGRPLAYPTSASWPPLVRLRGRELVIAGRGRCDGRYNREKNRARGVWTRGGRLLFGPNTARVVATRAQSHSYQRNQLPTTPHQKGDDQQDKEARCEQLATGMRGRRKVVIIIKFAAGCDALSAASTDSDALSARKARVPIWATFVSRIPDPERSRCQEVPRALSKFRQILVADPFIIVFPGLLDISPSELLK
jgi:hypothetical protein